MTPCTQMRPSRWASALTGVALLGAIAAANVPAAAAGPQAVAAGACNISGKQLHEGPTYLTSLRVSGGANCGTGLNVVRAYYRCRVHSGGLKGYCHSQVLGFGCSEKRTGISIQFDSSVTCSKGRQRVYHTYTQNT